MSDVQTITDITKNHRKLIKALIQLEELKTTVNGLLLTAEAELKEAQKVCSHKWKWASEGRHGSDSGMDYYNCVYCGSEKKE